MKYCPMNYIDKQRVCVLTLTYSNFTEFMPKPYPASTEHTTTPSSVTRKPTPECVNTFGSVTEHKLYMQNEIFVKDCQNMNSETLQRLRNEYHKNKSQTETHTRQPTTRGEQCRLM
ncbi:hypothetical protein KSF78_0007517 [Schistosoma japonicum]|nr:hypothetical protein KSF78_0007517 [Schistosoma japonicum]